MLAQTLGDGCIHSGVSSREEERGRAGIKALRECPGAGRLSSGKRDVKVGPRAGLAFQSMGAERGESPGTVLAEVTFTGHREKRGCSGRPERNSGPQKK